MEPATQLPPVRLLSGRKLTTRVARLKTDIADLARHCGIPPRMAAPNSSRRDLRQEPDPARTDRHSRLTGSQQALVEFLRIDAP
jgi:hypothetical protein